jgi:hypothetical protein
MTLVAAFRCRTGGILLCGDREENDGYNKREVDKLQRIPSTELQTCDIFLAGAGNADLIRIFEPRIRESLNRSYASGRDIFAEHEALLTAELAECYKGRNQEIKKNEDVEFIVVVAPSVYIPNRVPMLYRTNGTKLIPAPLYCACGTGKPIADYFADRLFHYDRMERGALAFLAAFILREAGTSASGVGLGNDMVFISDGDHSFRYVYKEKIEELQAAIPKLQDCIIPCWTNIAIPDWLLA